MICLNSVKELMTRTSTTFLQVGTSTPVVSICEVVRMTGVVCSGSWKLLKKFRPISRSSYVTRST
jgi:hypothetical protein